MAERPDARGTADRQPLPDAELNRAPTPNEPAGTGQEAKRYIGMLQRSVSPRERELLALQQADAEDRIARLQRRVEMYDRLVRCARNLSSILDLDSLLGAVLEEVVNLSGVDRSFILLRGESGDMRVERGYHAKLGHLSADENEEVSRSLAEKACAERKLISVSDALDREEFRTQQSIHDLRLNVVICVPLLTRNGVLGVLYLDSRRPENALTSDEHQLLEAFAAQASIAIENARLHKDLYEAQVALERENRDLKRALPGERGTGKILGKSRVMEEVRHRIAQVQEVDSPVLILGETGTGKDITAVAIHEGGPRASRRFLAIHCGALPEDLLESEMFGHKRGAFTGAVADKPGLFEAADGGSLFLDEIGEMPMKLQVKLLRALESGEIRRVGENAPRVVDVRIISATNRKLEDAVRSGAFREDLYYRLRVVTLYLPPLRDRSGDLLLLAEHFLKQSLEKQNKPYAGFTADAVSWLHSHQWPGNVRELANLIDGACVFLPAGKAMDARDLLLASGGCSFAIRPVLGNADAGLKGARAETERHVLLETLELFRWNVSKTAEHLGISRQHLHNRIRFHDLARPGRSPKSNGR